MIIIRLYTLCLCVESLLVCVVTHACVWWHGTVIDALWYMCDTRACHGRATECVCTLSSLCLECVLSVSWVCLECVCGVSLVCLSCVFGVSFVCLYSCLEGLLRVSPGCVWCVFGVFGASLVCLSYVFIRVFSVSLLSIVCFCSVSW